MQLAGYNQSAPPKQVVAGQPTDPPNLWTGVCQTSVAVTLRDRNNFVDLTGLAKIRWVTRTSGFHVVRPAIELAHGTWLVGDYAEGAASSNSTLFLESEFAMANVRWLALDIERVVTRGTWVEKPNLSRVDEIGFADSPAGQWPRLGRIRQRGAHRGVRHAGQEVTAELRPSGGMGTRCPGTIRDGVRNEPMTPAPVVHNVQIADQGQSERIEQARVVRKPPHRDRHDGAADDRHAQHTRAFARAATESFDGECEDGREHDRVEEPTAMMAHIAVGPAATITTARRRGRGQRVEREYRPWLAVSKHE